MAALGDLLRPIPAVYPIPMLVVTHLHKSGTGGFSSHLASCSRLPVSEAVDKQQIEAGHIYTAPADYHLLVERGGALALSVGHKVNWARPSIDVLFISAAHAFGRRLVGVILTGANKDGALGMKEIGRAGGMCIARDPATAEAPVMPLAAIGLAGIECVLTPTEIGRTLAGPADDSPERTIVKEWG